MAAEAPDENEPTTIINSTYVYFQPFSLPTNQCH